MSLTLAFDVYGTLIDTHGVVFALQKMMGDKASHFSHTWREKQLEYSFRRGLMQQYESFAVCTSHALDYTCEVYQINLTQEQKRLLLATYAALPAFADAAKALKKLHAHNDRLFAFSNGTAKAVNGLLEAADIRQYFQQVISVDAIQSFKPNPAVYDHFLQQSGAQASEAWLISSNPFDVIGAVSAGMQAAWVKRSANAIFDPWGIAPTITVNNLVELYDKLANP